MNSKRSFQNISILIIGSILFFQGCKEDPIITNSSINLSDPNVQPSVIYTYPNNGASGPFKNLYNGYDGNGSYHFFLQFNKLMDAYTINSETITIEGFDEPTYIQKQYYGDQFTDIFRFMVYTTNSYGYAKFAIGKTYTVRLKSTVQDVHGYTLNNDYVFSFTPEPSFRAVSSYPKGETENGTVTPWIQFNSKVPTSIFSSLKITPNINGSWSYLYSDSSRVSFVPTSNFTLDIPYTVEVLSTAKNIQNMLIAQPYSFTFIKKNSFKVNYMYLTQFEQRLAFRISFNGEVDTNTVRTAFSITPAIPGKVNFNFSTYDFYFVPDSDLTPGTLYTISLTAGVKSKNGISLEPYSSQIYSNDFQINSYFPNQYSEVSRYTAIELRTSYTVDTATVKSAFSISPSIPGTLIAYKNFIHFLPSQILQANTEYTVSINTNLKTVSGYPLKYSHSFSFRTGN